MPGRSYVGVDYRYGAGGHEKDDEVKGTGNHLDFGNYGYDPRLMRRWNVDPILKSHESPYAAFANNPIIFIDESGLDTLVFHTKQVAMTGRTKVFKVTFSLIQNGVESPVSFRYPSGASNFYITLPKEYWVHGNVWSTEGKSEMFSVRFEDYKKKVNAIRVAYPRGGSSRALIHYGANSNWSKGCPIPTCDITEVDGVDVSGNVLKKDKINAKNGQELLNETRRVYDQLIPSTEGKDKWGRGVTIPNKGFDFMVKTNSEYTYSPTVVPFSGGSSGDLNLGEYIDGGVEVTLPNN
jgi:hypothetical protein